MTIEINNESGQPADTSSLVAMARFVLDELRIHPLAELSIVLVDAETMTSYHEKFMGEPGPTDVLSFPMDELRPPGENEEPPEGLLGDIVLCPEVTTAQAAEHNRTPDQEAEYLLVHGILHLLGHDHAEPEEKAVMFGLHHRLMDAWQTERSLRATKGGRTEQ